MELDKKLIVGRLVVCVQEILDMQPNEPGKMKLNNTNGEIGCEEKDDDVPEEATLAKN